MAAARGGATLVHAVDENALALEIGARCAQANQLGDRITWEREKGRGAKANWKNNTEDIWFCTVGDDYYFDVAAVKLKRRVIAPYRTGDGEPKDWHGRVR